MYYSATLEYKSLCGHFGIPPSTLARVLRKAENALLTTLKSVPEAWILWSSFDQQKINKNLRQLRLDNIHRLYNYRVRTMNTSEIRNHFST